ncbi:transposase [Paraphaeosphaeria sporulosa]
MPAHSSHILQPLDVVCFAPLKLRYSQRVRDLARRRVFHINKEGFLPAFRDAFLEVFTLEHCKKAFEASGLVPLDASIVLDHLEVRLYTPPEQPLPETPWQSKTPSNTHEFSSQSNLVRDSFLRSPPTARSTFSQLIKGAEQMLHWDALQAARIKELEAQVEELAKRKSRKRKRIQHGGTMEYGKTADQVAASPSVRANSSKKARGGGASEGAPSTKRRCGICRQPGHNAQTCQKEKEISSESDVSTQYIFSDSSGDDMDDATT